MATSLSLLKSYGSDDETNSSIDEDKQIEEDQIHLNNANINPTLSFKSAITVESAPLVLYSVKNFF